MLAFVDRRAVLVFERVGTPARVAARGTDRRSRDWYAAAELERYVDVETGEIIEL